jgi:hypothetical protein
LIGTTWLLTSQFEQMANGGQPLLGGGRLVGLALLLDPGGDMQRTDFAEGASAGDFAPVEEILHGRAVGAPGMRVADSGGKNSRKRSRVSSSAAMTMAGSARAATRNGTSSFTALPSIECRITSFACAFNPIVLGVSQANFSAAPSAF